AAAARPPSPRRAWRSAPSVCGASARDDRCPAGSTAECTAVLCRASATTPTNPRGPQPLSSRTALRCRSVFPEAGRPQRKQPPTRQRRLHNPDVDQIPARRVRERQRIAAGAVSRAEPALKVDRPFLVGDCRRGYHFTLRNCALAPPPRLDETFAFQDVANRRGCWPVHFRRITFQPCLDLLRPEMRKPLPHRDDAIGHPIRRRMRAARRRMAQFLEPTRLSALPAPLPNVERLTADAVPPAQIANRENARLRVPKQRDTLFHRTGLLERHRPTSSNRATTLTCQEDRKSKLSGPSPVCSFH